jgi:hypothetical protein
MMNDLEAAQAIASIANECCYRSDGWEEHISETALKTIRSIRTNELQHREALIVLIASAYNEGFCEGTREHTSSKGGWPWSSRKQKYAALLGKVLTVQTGNKS